MILEHLVHFYVYPPERWVAQRLIFRRSQRSRLRNHFGAAMSGSASVASCERSEREPLIAFQNDFCVVTADWSKDLNAKRRVVRNLAISPGNGSVFSTNLDSFSKLVDNFEIFCRLN